MASYTEWNMGLKLRLAGETSDDGNTIKTYLGPTITSIGDLSMYYVTATSRPRHYHQ